MDCYVVIKAHFRILKTGKLNPDESELFFPQFLANFLLISGNLSRCFFMLHKWQNFRKLIAMFQFFLKKFSELEKKPKNFVVIYDT